MREEVVMAGKAFDVFYRDPIKCIEALLSNPELCNGLLLMPERHYHDETKEEQLFHEMNTGRWWWETQVRVK
jgi:hypothetical protein